MYHMKAADAFLLITALAIAWSLYRAHKDKNGLSSFNLFDLLIENNRVSKVACLVMGSFGVVSWIMVRLTFDGKMTEGYLTAYAGIFVVPLIAKMFSAPPPASTTTVYETKTTEKKVEGTPGGTISAETVTVKADTANVSTPKT